MFTRKKSGVRIALDPEFASVNPSRTFNVRRQPNWAERTLFNVKDENAAAEHDEYDKQQQSFFDCVLPEANDSFILHSAEVLPPDRPMEVVKLIETMHINFASLNLKKERVQTTVDPMKENIDKLSAFMKEKGLKETNHLQIEKEKREDDCLRKTLLDDIEHLYLDVSCREDRRKTTFKLRPGEAKHSLNILDSPIREKKKKQRNKESTTPRSPSPPIHLLSSSAMPVLKRDSTTSVCSSEDATTTEERVPRKRGKEEKGRRSKGKRTKHSPVIYRSHENKDRHESRSRSNSPFVPIHYRSLAMRGLREFRSRSRSNSPIRHRNRDQRGRSTSRSRSRSRSPSDRHRRNVRRVREERSGRVADSHNGHHHRGYQNHEMAPRHGGFGHSRNFHNGDNVRENPNPSKCLGVFGLPAWLREKELRKMFEPHGEVDQVNLVLNRETEECRGFGFVYYRSVEEAKKARNAMRDAKIEGKSIRVVYSLTDKPRRSYRD